MKRHRFTWHGICGVILLLLLSKVQESGDDASHTTIHIVDKGIEHTGTELEGHDVIIGDGSWDETTVAFAKNDLLTVGSHLQQTVAL